MAMDRGIAALIVVVEAGNLTKAADRLGLAQPSLTKRLKSLEAEYDVPLFERKPNGMVPTEFGTALYHHAKAIENQHRQAKEDINARKSGELDILRVGSGPVIRNLLLRSLFPKLRKEFPGMKLDFCDDVHRRRLRLVEDGDLDIFFGALSHEANLEGIEAYPVKTLSLGMLAHKKHVLFKKKKVTLEQLLEFPWVQHNDDGLGQGMIDKHFLRKGVALPSYEITTTSLEFAVELLAEGNFVMAGAVELVDAFDYVGVKALPITGEIDQIPICAYMRASSLSYPAVKRIFQLIA